MKMVFRNLGILALACFSFLLTDETIAVVKDNDKLMIEIKEKMNDYYINGVDGKITDNYIKLGYSGMEIDALKSYDQMKKIGYFNENMLIFNYIKPKNSIKDNQNKIINGNFKNEVALVFKNPDNIDKIGKILKNNGYNASFIIDKEFYLNNFESIEELKENNDIIISDEYKFFKKELNDFYCYSKKEEKCPGIYMVEETIDINNYHDLKNKLNKGSIILLNDANYLDVYIKYILSRGIKIVNMREFTLEELK